MSGKHLQSMHIFLLQANARIFQWFTNNFVYSCGHGGSQKSHEDQFAMVSSTDVLV
jgi:hypothetical protein